MPIIDDFNGSQPGATNGSVIRAIPDFPAMINLAEFGLAVFTSATNKIELKGTVEWFTSSINISQIYKPCHFSFSSLIVPIIHLPSKIPVIPRRTKLKNKTPQINNCIVALRSRFYHPPSK